MSGVPNGKLRILYILRMLQEETDEERSFCETKGRWDKLSQRLERI